MKILLIAGHFNAGGITTYLLTLARGLVESGHDVWLVTSGGNLEEKAKGAGIRHVVCPGAGLRCQLDPRLLAAVFFLARLVGREGIQVIHAQTRVTALLSALVSRATGVPYVTTCHGFFRPHPGRRLLGLWGRKTIAVSYPVQKHLCKDFLLSRERVVVVPNGIDTALFSPVSEEKRNCLRREYKFHGDWLIGLIARLSDVKGHSYLIEAVALLRQDFPRMKCFFFGEGPMEKELKEMVSSKGLADCIIFYPVVDRTAELLGMFDVFVLPSISEGLGLSAMEAQAAGLPVVASDVGGIPDIVSDGETGFLVPSCDPGALAQALRKVFSDSGRAGKMGRRARTFIMENFSIRQMTDGTLRVYEDVTVR